MEAIALLIGVLMLLVLGALLLFSRERVVWRESQGPTIDSIHFTDVPPLCLALQGGETEFHGSVLGDAPAGPVFVSSTGPQGLLINRSSTKTVSLVIPNPSGPPTVLDVPLDASAQRPEFTVRLDHKGVAAVATSAGQKKAVVDVAGLKCDDAILYGSRDTPNQISVRAVVVDSYRPSTVVVLATSVVSFTLLCWAFAGTRRAVQ